MRKLVLHICLFFSLVNLTGQNVSGIWFAGCNLKIDKYAGVDEYKVDSIYGVEGSIVDFISSDKFVIKSIGEVGREGVYSQTGDTLYLTVDEYNWTAILENEELKLKLIDSADYGLELYYKKLNPSGIPKEKLLNQDNLMDSNWIASYDWGYSVLSFKDKDSTDLIERPKAYISNFSEIRTGTETGNYQIDAYKNHLFLYVLERETLSEKIIHISEYSSGNYNGTLFDCIEPLSKPIPFEKVKFSKLDVVSEKDFKEEVKSIHGRYQLRLLDLDKQGISESVKTVIAYIEFLEESNCSIEAYITENVDDVAVLSKLDKTGTWFMDASGQFIEIEFDDGTGCFLTIKKGEKKTELYLNRNPWPEEPELNTVLKFKKQ